jgi:hypothetical protein
MKLLGPGRRGRFLDKCVCDRFFHLENVFLRNCHQLDEAIHTLCPYFVSILDFLELSLQSLDLKKQVGDGAVAYVHSKVDFAHKKRSFDFEKKFITKKLI